MMVGQEVNHSEKQLTQLPRQRSGCKMFWVSIVGSKIIGLFKVDDDININAEKYGKSLNKTYFFFFLNGLSCNQETLNSRIYSCKIMLLQILQSWILPTLLKKLFKNTKIMEWYLNSPDINLEENLWYIKEMDMKMGYTIQRSLGNDKNCCK